MIRWRKPKFTIAIAREALESVFDECDKYDVDETGGRVLGTFSRTGNRIDIEVKAVLEPGPKAQRTPTYFLQDGDHQERLFRAIEAVHPEIEHLGNWHTHHVNGLSTLSGGDKTTYFKIVNHEKHNTDFFYALLVVRKNGPRNPRYAIKHFIFLRGDTTFYEVSESDVQILDVPAIRVPNLPRVDAAAPSLQLTHTGGANAERAKDQEFFGEFYPALKPLLARSIGAPYWKGPMSLIDGSHADVVAMESSEGGKPSYSITSSCKAPGAASVLETYKDRQFPSARHAVLQLERDLNQAIFKGKRS